MDDLNSLASNNPNQRGLSVQFEQGDRMLA